MRMNGQKSLLRLLIVTQTFLLFSVIALPTLIHYLHQTAGKVVYGFFAALCIVLALLLRRSLADLD
jgi:hypothetical protein